MSPRFVLASFALAGSLALTLMVWPAAAQEAVSIAPAEDAGGPVRPQTRRLRLANLQAPDIVQVQPPPRPDDLAADPAEAAGSGRPAESLGGEAVVEGQPNGPVVTVLPPFRPTLGVEAQEAQRAQEAAVAPDAALRPESRPDGVAEEAPGHVVAVLPPPRPTFLREPAALREGAALPDVPVAPAPVAPSLFAALFGPRQPAVPDADPATGSGRPFLDGRIAYHARLNQVPESLVHRIVVRESRYNPRAVGRGGAMGLMQIKTGTARALGYEGGPAGLLDAETNLTYAVKYLAGAYRTARGNHDLSVRFYARGYYYESKRQGAIQTADRRGGRRGRRQDADATLGVDRVEAPVVAANETR